MNLYFVNKYLLFREQDSKKVVLLLLFSTLPFTVLLPHAHTVAGVWSIALFALALAWRRRAYGALFPPSFFGGRENVRRSVFLYLIFLALSLSGVILPEAWRETLLALALRLSFFLPLLLGDYRQDLCRILSLLGGAIGFYTVLSLLLLGGRTDYSDPSLFPTLERASGLLQNPNVTAAFLLPCALLALDGWLSAKEGRRLSGVFALGASLGILATYSRGGILALILCALWLFSRRFGLCRVFVTCLALLPLLLLLTPDALLSRLASLASPDSSMRYRLSLWQSILRLPKKSLLFGVGEGKRAMMTALEGVLAAGLLAIEHTHSLFFHLLLSSGLVGLSLFSALLLRALWGKAPHGGRAALLALLFFGVFDDPLYYGQTEALFWFTLGLCL